MAITAISMNPEEDRQARAVLKRLCEDGPEMVDIGNASSVKLLERIGMASTFNNTATVTDKGRAENPSRVLSARP